MTGRSTLLILLILGLLMFVVERASAQVGQQVELQTTGINLAGCIKYDHENEKNVFKDKQSLENALRTDKYAADCKKTIKEIDFEKYSVLGVNIRNAQCWEFTLEGKVFSDAANNRYLFLIERPPYLPPCRGLTDHHLWVRVPRVPENYDVVFEIKEKEKQDEPPNKCLPLLETLDAIDE